MTVLVQGANAVAYVPRGAWSSSQTGIAIANVEGASVTNKVVATPAVVNSCAANSLTGRVACTANNTDIYLLTGTTLTTTLHSNGSGTIGFSGGSCTNCSIAVDGKRNRAVIGLAVGSKPGFQILDMGTNTLLSPFLSANTQISENPLIDPGRNLLLSPAENKVFELVDLTTPSSPNKFLNTIAGMGGEPDSAGEDCGTGIALAPGEFSSELYLADLSRAKFNDPTAGKWTAPSQVQTLTESNLSAGFSGIAVAQGAAVGIISGEFGGRNFTAISLPKAKLASGNPAVLDWVTCDVPDPAFSMGLDPHTLTAFKSPSSGNGIALLTDGAAAKLVVVDLTKMLDKTIVPRSAGGHACARPLPATVAKILPLPAPSAPAAPAAKK